MNSLKLLGICLLAAASTSQAASISLSSGNIGVENKAGNALVGGSVQFGWFTTYSAANIAEFTTALSGSREVTSSYITANFIPVGNANSDVDYGVWSASGTNGVLGIKPNSTPAVGEQAGVTVSGTLASSTWTSSAANSRDTAGIPRGTRMFLLVYNNTDPSQATELGIFSATNWVISTNTLVTASNISLSTVDDAAGTGVTREFWRGSKGSLMLGDFSAPIPEPASLTLAGLAILGFLGKRRRN